MLFPILPKGCTPHPVPLHLLGHGFPAIASTLDHTVFTAVWMTPYSNCASCPQSVLS